MPNDQSSIEWTDATWSPVVGCSKVSPGCARCYAEELHRTRLDGRHGYPPFRPWTPENAEHNVTLMPERLEQPLHWRKPRMVFTNSMSDLFHENVPAEFIREVFNVMRCCDGGITAATGQRRPAHIFQVLTKRPERMRDLALSRGLGFDPASPPPNVWLGVSIENRRFVGRADLLRETPAAVRFISAEPLLGPLIDAPHPCHTCRYGPDAVAPGSVEPWGPARGTGGAACPDCEGTGTALTSLSLAGIDWLICGGESGHGHRPMRVEWARDLRDACLATRERCMTVRDSCHGDPDIEECICGGRGGTAFFFKQHGGRTPKAGGRELDGRTWDELPARAATEVAHG